MMKDKLIKKAKRKLQTPEEILDWIDFRLSHLNERRADTSVYIRITEMDAMRDFVTFRADPTVHEKVNRLILDQQRKHVQEWGGPDHDDQHDHLDFAQYIRKQLDKLQSEPGFTEAAQERLIRIAALAKDALESYERKFS